MQGFTLPSIRRTRGASQVGGDRDAHLMVGTAAATLPPLVAAPHSTSNAAAAAAASPPPMDAAANHSTAQPPAASKLPRLKELLHSLEEASSECHRRVTRGNVQQLERHIRDELADVEDAAFHRIVAAFDEGCITTCRRQLLLIEVAQRTELTWLEARHRNIAIAAWESATQSVTGHAAICSEEVHDRRLMGVAFDMGLLRLSNEAVHAPPASLLVDAAPHAGLEPLYLAPPPTVPSDTHPSTCCGELLLSEAYNGALRQLSDPDVCSMFPSVDDHGGSSAAYHHVTLKCESLIVVGAATAHRIRWENTRAQIQQTTYTRPRAALDVELSQPPTEEGLCTRRAPDGHLPGVVVPWALVVDERTARRFMWDEEERHRLLLEACHIIQRNVLHVEHTHMAVLRRAYVWAAPSTERLRAVLLIQRWYRCCRIASFRSRRRCDIKRRLGCARDTARSGWTASLMDEKMEAVEDATLRDVWAEDYETGEMGLFYPYRKQMLEIAAERHSKKLYRDFVASLRRTVSQFVIRSHEQTATEMYSTLLLREPEQRWAIAQGEQRGWLALQRVDWRAARAASSPDNGSVEWWEWVTEGCEYASGALGGRFRPVDLVTETLESRHALSHALTLDEAMSSAWSMIYTSTRAGEHRRVQYCRSAWQQFRVEAHRFVDEHRDSDWYTAITAARVPSADVHASRRSLSEVPERIPSAGYQRAGSAGYRRLGSAGYQRLGSAGYQRLGSASQRSVPSRLGSAGPQRSVVHHHPAPPSAPKLWWDGYEAAIKAKLALQTEEASRRTAIEAAADLHLHFAAIFNRVVLGGGSATVSRFSRSVAVLQSCEVSQRAAVAEEELFFRRQVRTQQDVEVLAVRVCDVRVSVAQLCTDEYVTRERLVRESIDSLDAVVSFALTWMGILSLATENLRKIGLVPRGPGEGRRRSYQRRGSVLHQDSMASKRKHFTTIVAVVTLIQRWWRFYHHKPYRVGEAAVDMLQFRKRLICEASSEGETLRVLKQQLQGVNEHQTISQRMLRRNSAQRPQSSSDSDRVRVSSSVFACTTPQQHLEPGRAAPRPASSSTAMRTAVNERLLQPQVFFVSWSSLTAEEATSRRDWALMESLARQRLHSFNATHLIGRLVEKKIVRMITRHEPSNRARIETDALREFVSLFFTRQADDVRGAHLAAKEAKERRALAHAEAANRWELEAACNAATEACDYQLQLMAHGAACTPSEQTTVAPYFTPAEAQWVALQKLQKSARCIDRWRRSHFHAAPRRESHSHPSPRCSDVGTLVRREASGRDAIWVQFLEAQRCVLSEAWIHVHELFGAFELSLTTGRDRVVACRVFDFEPPRKALPVAQMQCLFEEFRGSRDGLMEQVVVTIYYDVLVDRHRDFLEIVFEQQKLIAMRLIVPEVVAICRDLADALCRRVSHTATKPKELELLEHVSRQAIEEWQEMTRYHWGFTLTAATLIRQYYRNMSSLRKK